MLEAVLWDVDGTLAETERDGHRIAFNRAFEELGVPWRWGEAHYGRLLDVAGGRERLLHDMLTRAEAPATDAERGALASRVHQLKNQHYARIVAEAALPLRPGVLELMGECERAGVRMGIATTTSRANVEALLGRHLGAAWRERFAAVMCAEDAPRKKPDPQVYEAALRALSVNPHAVVAIEDSPAGIEAALRAQVPVIVTRSCYFPHAHSTACLAVGPSLGEIAGWDPAVSPPTKRVSLAQIAQWHASARAAAKLL